MQPCSDPQTTSSRSDPRPVQPLRQDQRLDAIITVPGSKSLTQRALIAAALAEGVSQIQSPLASEDTRHTMTALQQMGIVCDSDDPQNWRIHGQGGAVRRPEDDIFLGNNGTATRFLTSLAALGTGAFRITGNERMKERPIWPLIQALRGWGVEIKSEQNGCPPLCIQARGIKGGLTALPAGESSQYLSSLLLVAPYAQQESEIAAEGKIFSRPYVSMTMAVMADFGLLVDELPMEQGGGRFRVPLGRYRARSYEVEGDFSAASYFWAAAAITGGRVKVSTLSMSSCQGDKGFVDLLVQMGCACQEELDGIAILGDGALKPIEADMGDMPDVAPTLAVVAAFAEGRSVISNIAHLRIKECDRLSTVASGLKSLGAEVEEEESRIIIHGRRDGANLHGGRIRTYNDHRMAMSFAVAGLRIPGVEIEAPECVAKSFPDFWQWFAGLEQGDAAG